MTLKPAYILLPLAGLFALGLFAQKRASAMLTYLIDGIGFAWEGTAPLLRLDMIVQNPSNEQFTIKSIVANAYTNGHTLGNISMFQTIVINPHSVQVLPVFVRMNLSAVVSDLIALLQKGSGNPQEITLKGYVNANGFVSPLNMTYKLT